MTCGEHIKEFRKKAGLTQRQLAEKASVATITIQQYELGKRQPRIEQLRKIAKALDCYVGDLVDPGEWNSLDMKNAWSDSDSGHVAILAAFDSMNPTGQQKAVTVVEDLAKVPEYQKAQNPVPEDTEDMQP